MANYPTEFAKAILRGCDLYPITDIFAIEDAKERELWQTMEFTLREFQSMAVFSDYATCMHMYTGITLDDDQRAALQLVHKLTKDWSKGRITEELMKVMTNDSRTAPAIGALLLSHLHGLPGESGSNNNGKLKRLIIKTKEKLAK